MGSILFQKDKIMTQNIRRTWITLVVAAVTSMLVAPAYSQSYKEVTMSVGETQTFYLPSTVTSKDLKSVTFYSNGISYVQVTSYTKYSVTVKAIKAFSSPIIVRCDYRYFVRSGSFTYETSGAYDYRITVVSGDGGVSGVEPTSIRFSSTVRAIKIGESVQLTPTVLPANAAYTLTWSINDSSVATISQDGLLTGKSEGAADLKVKAQNGVYAMLRVVVSKPSPINVYVTPSSVSITEGETRYLSVSVYPSNASQSVTWSSSNTAVVTVSSAGKVTAVKAGTATITARTSNGITGTCSVTCKSATSIVVLSDKDGNDNLPMLANIQYERTLYKGWNSVCVPFAITQAMLDAFASDCKIVTPMEVEIIGDERVLSVKEVGSVDAGKACFIYAPCDVLCNFNLSNVTLKSEPDETSILKGAYQRTVIGPNMYKLDSHGSSLGITCGEDAIVGPYRAYIEFEQIPQTRAACSPIEIKLQQIK